MKINKKRIRWGRILLTFVAVLGVLGAVAGFLGNKLAQAYEGDYWTTELDGLSITVVSVSQNGVPIEPTADGEGGYYFVTANNTDPITVGSVVDGMVPEDSYYYYANDNWWEGRQDLTYENNGQTIYQELKPHVYFQNEDDCHGDCWIDPMSGIYYVGPSINRNNGYGVQKNLIIHPASVGSHRVEIVSVKQGNTNLTFVNNEYQITNYNTPVSLTYKLKNLEVGKNYTVEIGNMDYYSFRAEATEVTATRELTLNYIGRHINTSFYLYSSEASEQVMLYFKVADNDFRPLGDIIIDEIEQGGVALTPVADTSGWRREYTFTINDAQGLNVALHTTNATAGMNYYILFNMYGGSGSVSSRTPLMVTGEELEMGTMLTVPAAFGMSDNSLYNFSLSINTTGTMIYSSSEQTVVYQNYAEPQSSSDYIKFSIYEDENVPRYGAAVYYSDGTEIDGNRISPARHDATHPLLLEVRGERYDNGRTYNIEATASIAYGGETFYRRVFTVTGAELNEGTVLTLTGLTLSLPEFDPSGATSGYDLMYDLALSIDGLEQSGEMLYVYEGWTNSSITFNNGEVVAMGSGGGIGGDVYTTTNGVTMRKSSLDSSRGAKLYYFAGGFDDALSYDYTLYYNGNAGEDWWYAPAGTTIQTGVMLGSALNSDGISVDMATPTNESEGVLYTLLISRNGKIVRIVRDSIVFTTEPKLESFKFTADSDSFMQTDRTGYRVAMGTDVVATLTGSGFENETEYRLWVSYEGYRFVEDEYNERYPEYVNLTELNNSIVVTGAQLNAGYVYNLNYVEAFEGVNSIEVGFTVSDRDAGEPSWYGLSGNGYYAGHAVYIEYVNDDEVFRDDGYQVNEDGTITNVSQPDEPHGEIPVDNRATGVANVTVEGSTLTVVSEKPVMVVGHRNNGEWVLLYGWDVVENGEERTNHYSVGDCNEVVVALKGNLKDDDTIIDLLDANVIYRSQLNPDSPAYRALTPAEQILADLNGDLVVDLLDANVIYRSQLNPSSPAYQEISW